MDALKIKKVPKFGLLLWGLIFYLCFPQKTFSINLKVGETYTCDIGYVNNLQSCFWTISAPDVIEFVRTPGAYDTQVTVRALKGSSSPVVVQCKYYWLELDPMTGRYTYSRNTYKDWTFFVKEDKPQPQSVELNTYSFSLSPGESRSIGHRVIPSDADQTLTWSTNNGCVSVSSGYVTAKYEGTATVTARAVNGVYATCKVKVESLEPTGVSLSSPSPIKIGQTIKLTPSLTPSNASTTFSWNSSSPNIASVDGSGNVTGKSEGTTRITVRTANGLSDWCSVEVYKPVPSSISFSESNVRLLVGDSKTLTYSVNPSDAIYTVSWQSDAPQIVDVSDAGRITAKKEGSANVTVTTDNGKKASCRVTVPPQPKSIRVTPSEIELIIGRSAQLSYILSPSNAMARSITWSTSDYAVCSVSQDGLLTARKPGSAIITATTDNGCKSSCRLIVPEPLFQLFVWMQSGEKTGYLSTDKPQFRLEGEVIHFETTRLKIDIDKNDFDRFTLEQVLPEHPKAISLPEEMKIGLGRTGRLIYTLTPADAQTSVSWLNSDPEIASVTPSGVVRGLKVGTTTLRAQTSNGLRAACRIEVPEPHWKFYVWQRSGPIVGYELEEHPDVALGPEFFTLTTSGTRVRYPADDVIRFTLEDAAVNDPEVGISSIEMDTPEKSFHENNLSLTQLHPYASVRVFDAAGRLVRQATADAQGFLQLNLESLRAGVYIINSGHITFKIQKK